MMACIAAETLQVFGIRTEVRNARLNHPECVFHHFREVRMPRVVGRCLEYESQSLLDQVFELAAT